MLTIRQALPADLTTVREIGIASYVAHFGALWRNPQEMAAFLDQDFSVEALEKSLRDAQTCWLLAYQESVAVGFARINFDSRLEATATTGAELQKIYFMPGFAGLGYGERLYDEVQRRAIGKQQRQLWLDVLKTNVAAQRFYQRQGMQIVGEYLFSSGSESVELWCMAKPLDPVRCN
ncbi:GNAT family N-acetyltransferase [Serratia aquatilis]|uniref:GNAT family N-acetyltransferase n=1 Tax=Serratia aquatilis TaxID=1737515 RepID=A0ABV6EK86_9GAMM